MPTIANQPVHLAGLNVPPGSRATGWLVVGEDWRRESERVPVAVVHGVRPGSMVYLQAVSDGDEMNGLRVVQRLLATLDPEEMAGAVVAVPVANPGAFAVGHSTDPRDGRKLNRCFPGIPDGTITERLAWTLFHGLILHCDVAIDLHQNGEVPMVPEVRVRTGRRGPKYTACLALAMAFGLDNILDQQGPPGQLARAAPARGIPAIDPELGGNPGVSEAAVELGVRGLQNVLRHAGVLSGPLAPAGRPYIARGLLPIQAPAGGVVAWRAALGQRVSQGEVLGEVADVFGSGPQPVTAPADGVIWFIHPERAVSLGATLGAIGVRHDIG